MGGGERRRRATRVATICSRRAMVAAEHANRKSAKSRNVTRDVLSVRRRKAERYWRRSHESTGQRRVISAIQKLAARAASVTSNAPWERSRLEALGRIRGRLSLHGSRQDLQSRPASRRAAR